VYIRSYRPADCSTVLSMTANHPAEVAAQYATEQHLRTRIDTHRRYTVGPDLEASFDELLALGGQETLLDVGTGPGD
jgi:protein-L-isoaspartate O-methyltransferase